MKLNCPLDESVDWYLYTLFYNDFNDPFDGYLNYLFDSHLHNLLHGYFHKHNLFFLDDDFDRSFDWYLHNPLDLDNSVDIHYCR